MNTEDYDKMSEKHAYMLDAHDEAIKNLSPLPEVINGLKNSIDRLNDTMNKIEEKAQTQSNCKAIHFALDSLRMEQLTTIRDSIKNQGERIGANEKEIAQQAKTIGDMRTELDNANGAIRLLKFSLPIVIGIALAFAKFVQ